MYTLNTNFTIVCTSWLFAEEKEKIIGHSSPALAVQTTRHPESFSREILVVQFNSTKSNLDLDLPPY